MTKPRPSRAPELPADPLDLDVPTLRDVLNAIQVLAGEVEGLGAACAVLRAESAAHRAEAAAHRAEAAAHRAETAASFAKLRDRLRP